MHINIYNKEDFEKPIWNINKIGEGGYGDRYGIYAIGHLYKVGCGVEKDYSKVLNIFTK